MNAQYKKGALELCVLSLLHKRDCCGYEISEFLSERVDISDGTVYPILRKLKGDGLLSTYLQEESGGPPAEILQADRSGTRILSKRKGGIPEFRPIRKNAFGGWKE